MARRQDRLVEEIRARRHSLGGHLHELVSLEPLREHIRHGPAGWLLGSALAGLLCGRILPPLVLRHAGGWVRSKLRDTLVAMALAAARDGGRPECSGDGAGAADEADGESDRGAPPPETLTPASS